MGSRVAGPSECLLIMGKGTPAGIKITKKAYILPEQSCTILDTTPVHYSFEVQAMSAEKLPFVLHTHLVIGPLMDDGASLLKYAKIISRHDVELPYRITAPYYSERYQYVKQLIHEIMEGDNELPYRITAPHHGERHQYVKQLIQEIIEGETRILAASMTMEKISKEDYFKPEAFEMVLSQFGLLIKKGNIKLLVDHVGAAKQNLQNTAMAKKIIISAPQRKREGKKGIKLKAKVYKNNRREAQVAEANAKLAKKKAKWTKEAKIAEVEGNKAVALRKAELRREVEQMNALTLNEKHTAEFHTKANIEYETKMKEADWELYRKQKAAEAYLYEKEKEADGDLYAKKKEAEGVMLLAEAHATYIHTLLDAMGGNYEALRDYLMISGGMYQEL